MAIPKNKKSHKPIIGIDNYSSFDWTGNHTVTDTIAIDIGIPSHQPADVSLKIWRNTSTGRISRQSEDIPITRNLDLTLLFIDVLLGLNRGSNGKTTFNDSNPPCGILSSLTPKDICSPADLHLIYDFYYHNRSIFDQRLIELRDKLNCLFQSQSQSQSQPQPQSQSQPQPQPQPQSQSQSQSHSKPQPQSQSQSQSHSKP